MSELDKKIEKYERRVEIFRAVHTIAKEDPEIVSELRDIILELAGKDGATDKAQEDIPFEPPAEDAMPYKEYKTKIAPVIVKILTDSSTALTSQGVYRKITNEAVELRPENDSPKGLGKLLAVLERDKLIKRTRLGRSWYYHNLNTTLRDQSQEK